MGAFAESCGSVALHDIAYLCVCRLLGFSLYLSTSKTVFSSFGRGSQAGQVVKELLILDPKHIQSSPQPTTSLHKCSLPV